MSINLPKERDYKKSIYWKEAEKIMKQTWFKEGQPKPIRSVACPCCNGTGKRRDRRTGEPRDCVACLKHPGESGFVRADIAPK